MRKKIMGLTLASIVILMAVPAFAGESVTTRDAAGVASYSNADVGINAIVLYKVTANLVPVKSAPGQSGTNIGLMNMGNLVYYYGEPTVSKDGYTWMYVSCGSPVNAYGWINTQYLQKN